ncbi:MAG: twin-arginine translocation signal domain-containing protein [Anaerolineae bacterium]|nr:twin-arginine translocation signal domain-containing protein [Anaerolineae bacterium]
MLSRRQFLQAAGIAVVAHALPRLPAPSFEPPYGQTLFGRALETLPVHAAPDAAAPLVTRLWSDTVTPILDTRGGWYRLPNGFAPRQGIQPMIAPARRAETPAAPPFWAEVSGALAVVRAFCAANAPIRARVGHGGVLYVTDYLPDDGIDWYGVAENEGGDLLGWTQTAAWSPASVDHALPTLSLAVDTRTRQLTAYDGDRVLLTAPVATGRDLLPGVYPITRRRPTESQDEHTGAPWSLAFGDDLTLSGAYWHNRFGTTAPGAALQVTPALAKWLYPRAATVIIS